MHEMSLAESVLQIIEDQAAGGDFSRVTQVWLEIGKLSGAEPDAMRFCFDAVTRGSVAEGAALEIIEVAAQGKCQECGAEFEVTARWQECPKCGSFFVHASGGEEMRVKELAVE